MKQFSKRLLCGLGFSLICLGGLHAQSLDQAKKLYNDGQYAEAKPVFEKLVTRAPSNSFYNLWYGVCCYETNDLELAEKYLSLAVKRRVIDAYRYLGEVYYRTYRFDKAVDMYEEYIELMTKKKRPVDDVEPRLDLAENARRMVDKVEDIQIIDSLVVDKNEFLSAYTLSEESGSLDSFVDFFQTTDLIHSSVYMNQKGDMVYYAHPNAEDRYSLYSQSRLLDKWGDEKQLPMNDDGKGDDNYPYVLSDGVTMYYASTGNGSLGGYDIFLTRYNSATDTYLAPEQLGMPFNSPFNDYMLVIDEVKGLGWFVSDRFQPEDKVCVYLFIPNDGHVRIESDDDGLKRSRAMIQDIKKSWKEGENYASLIELSHKVIPYGKQEVKKDFEFVVNNDVVYYTLSEIKSPEAKECYEKVISYNKQILQIERKLEELRVTWSKAGAAKREQMRPQILEMEAKLDEMQPLPAEWEKKARNAEIKYLKK